MNNLGLAFVMMAKRPRNVRRISLGYLQTHAYCVNFSFKIIEERPRKRLPLSIRNITHPLKDGFLVRCPSKQ
jgi:hypothetical protein